MSTRLTGTPYDKTLRFTPACHLEAHNLRFPDAVIHGHLAGYGVLVNNARRNASNRKGGSPCAPSRSPPARPPSFQPAIYRAKVPARSTILFEECPEARQAYRRPDQSSG